MFRCNVVVLAVCNKVTLQKAAVSSKTNERRMFRTFTQTEVLRSSNGRELEEEFCFLSWGMFVLSRLAQMWSVCIAGPPGWSFSFAYLGDSSGPVTGAGESGDLGGNRGWNRCLVLVSVFFILSCVSDLELQQVVLSIFTVWCRVSCGDQIHQGPDLWPLLTVNNPRKQTRS